MDKLELINIAKLIHNEFCSCGCHDHFSKDDSKIKESILQSIKENNLGIKMTDLGLSIDDFTINVAYEINEDDSVIKNNISSCFYEDYVDGVPTAYKPTSKNDRRKLNNGMYLALFRYEKDPRVKAKDPNNSRDFCVQMMALSQTTVWTYEDIRVMDDITMGRAMPSGGNSFDCFKWRAGNYCQHRWVKYYYDIESKKLVKKPQNQPNQPMVR